jgi:hypothetical protein
MSDPTQNDDKPTTAPAIYDTDTSNWECKPAVESTMDATTFNCYFVGDAKSFSFQGEIPDEAYEKVLANGVEVTPEMRAKAIEGFASIVLGELHQKGGQYGGVDKNQQPLLIKPHDSTVPFLEAMNAWVPDEMVKRHVEWGIEWEEEEMDERDIRRKHTSLWKKPKKSKDGKPPLDGKAFNARVFQDSVHIFIQDPQDHGSFTEDGRLRDIPKGAQCAFVMEFGGIRIRSTNGQYALMTPTVKEIWAFARTKAVSGTASFRSGAGPKIRKTGFKIRAPPTEEETTANPPATAMEPAADPPATDGNPAVVTADAEENDAEEGMETEGPGTATMIDA